MIKIKSLPKILSRYSNVAILIIVAGFSTAWYVISNESERTDPDFYKTKLLISKYETEIQEMSQQPDLPKLNSIWFNIQSIASQYNVKVSTIEKIEDAKFTEDEIPCGQAWFGSLQGSSKNVAAAALEIQKTLPVLFGQAVIDNKVMGLSFAAMGIIDFN
ncbi:hypothetical protein [Methylophaga thalassica]|uniref:hypothetical protein n=1 Tax=Methylophaga thalassica TaxID=40223 RepID=UPI002E7BE8F2|nr:hypothetical protein [Methylophaga thalassica]WVI83850.1 hypothetical protein VSX76_00430 [Methylophaga thalassica]